MMVNKIQDIEHYKHLLIECEVKGVLTNNYMMPNEVEGHLANGMLGFVKTGHNLFLLVNKGNCYRVYYYILDLTETVEFPDDSNYAIEILYRGDNFYPQREIDYWKTCGFETNLIRDFYIGKAKDMVMRSVESDVEIILAKTVEEVKFALNLFNSYFDSYTADFISDDEIPALLEEHSISVAKSGDDLLGACHAYEKSNVIYLGHLAVSRNARGKKVSRLLMQEMIERLWRDDKTRYSLWVQRNNNVAVSLYETLGYKYSNKSTISLLKLHN